MIDINNITGDDITVERTTIYEKTFDFPIGSCQDLLTDITVILRYKQSIIDIDSSKSYSVLEEISVGNCSCDRDTVPEQVVLDAQEKLGEIYPLERYPFSQEDANIVDNCIEEFMQENNIHED